MARTTIPAELVAINAIQGTLIADNAITAVHIATNAVSGTLVADNAITSTHIAQNNVTATQIAMNTITVTQMADDAIETAKINASAVTTAKINNGAVTDDKLAANSVTSAKIVNGTIVAADLADNAVTIAKMASLARGKIIYGDSAGDPAALTLGSAGTFLISDGTDISWSNTLGTADMNLVIGDGTGDPFITINKSTTGTSGILLKNAGNNKGKILLDANEDMQFFINNTTGAATIKENGDVLFGNTVVNPASGFSNQKGFGYDFSHGTVEIAVDSDTTCLTLGRNHGNNGVMTVFRKEGTSFASLGIEGGDSLYIQAGTTSGSGILCHGTGGKILPARQGTSIDATIDLGQSSRRWKKGWFQKLDATDANGNTSVGYECHNVLGATGNSGDSNTAIGYQANEKLTTGNWNNAMGYRAGMNVTTGSYNIAIGGTAMYTNQGGHRNTAVGYQALYTATGNDHNTAIGNRAMVTAGNNGSCTAVGSQALENATTGGHYNTAIGHEAGIASTTGYSNVFVGYQAGYDATDANNNVFVGRGTRNDNAGTSNQVVIGNTARSQGSGKVTIGTSTSTYSYLTIGGTSWSGSSDVRLKKEITDSTAGLSFINDLRPVTFKWKTKSEVDASLPHYEKDSTEPVIGNNDSNVLTKHGFIAQEVKTAIDNHSAVKDGCEIWEENRDGIQNFSPTALIPMLVKAIQELKAEIEELKK